MMKFAVAFAVLFLVAGAILRHQEQYKVTGIRYYEVSTEQTGGCDSGPCNMVEYRLSHGRGTTVKAECQAFDPNNHCSTMQLGHSYPLERDDKLHFLSMGEYPKTSLTLLITEEHRE
jgi:hypothetical protein